MFRRFAYEHLALHLVPRAEGDPAVVPPAPAPVVAPWGDKADTAWNVGDKPWYETLPDGPSKDLVRTKNYANPQILADSYYALNQAYNQKEAGLTMPAADAPEATWNDFYTKLGRPEAPDKYEIKAPEGVTLDDKLVGLAKETAFKLGLPPAKAQQMADMYLTFENKYAEDAGKEYATQQQTQIEALKTKHGANYDKFLADGRTAFKALGLPEDVVAAAEANIGAAAMITIMSRLGELSSEGKLTTGESGKGGIDGKMTKEQAQARIDTLRADEAFNKKFLDPHNPEHASAVKEMERLYALV